MPAKPVDVVVFTGGRGSAVLSERLLSHAGIRVTLAVNGYDDGASTGEVRRFLGDALGPSDFRKNASRAALAKHTASRELVDLLDRRLPVGMDAHDADVELRGLRASAPAGEKAEVFNRLDAFLAEWRAAGRAFQFGDCAIGNLVFAGCYLHAGRRFNAAVDDYAALLGLPAGLIEDVTDGTNAHLVALDVGGRVLGTEEAIVDSRRANRIDDIFLIDRPLSADECLALGARGVAAARQYFDQHAVAPNLNPRLAERLDLADVIVYAPGTQHSSLFPSYLTRGLTERIASNYRAVKLLITNLNHDAEIAGASAVTLVERALFFLTDKGRRPFPGPSLVTHYLLNDPKQAESSAPRVPLGQLATLEDPRLVRIGQYEDGVSGRHDAAKVIEPFIESLLATPAPERVAVCLYGADSANKIAQTLLEMARGLASGLLTTPPVIHVYAQAADGLDPAFVAHLPFEVSLFTSELVAQAAMRAATGQYSYVALFESSGMYRGDDLIGLFRYVERGRLDAAWGSRRLSQRDIEESFRRYDDRGSWLRALSRIGSHLLSATYLLLYGRYIADTLSGVRVMRVNDTVDVPVPFSNPFANQYLLARLLKRQADVLEVPVQFLPLSSKRVHRTGVSEGLWNLSVIISQRFARRSSGSDEHPPAGRS
jgi:2-phospho-L-lactate transferase/gluconeogenesis factor (CofD/UPF0052 family)